MSRTLRTGLTVETFDGRTLGVIDNVQFGHIRVRSRFRRSSWMSDGLVRSVDERRVRLHIDKRVAHRYQAPAGDSMATVLRAPLSIVCGLLTATGAGFWISL